MGDGWRNADSVCLPGQIGVFTGRSRCVPLPGGRFDTCTLRVRAERLYVIHQRTLWQKCVPMFGFGVADIACSGQTWRCC